MTTRPNPDKVLADLVESAIEARAHYQVWWALANQARPRLVARMNLFPDFFAASQRAHFDSMILHLAHLFDKRRDVSSIQTYLRVARASFPVTDVSAVRSRFVPLAKVQAAVAEIRHNLVAHKNVGLTERQVFTQAGVTPNQVRDLILEAAAVVDDFRRRRGWTNGVFTSDRFSQATLGVLESMRKT